jgi:hypothetical protein
MCHWNYYRPQLHFILLLLFNVGLVVQSDHDELEYLTATLRSSCTQRCLSQLKDDTMCSRFCEFVNDIIDEHLDELWVLYQRGGRQLEPFRWALHDLIDWRLKTKEDNLHIIATRFLEGVAHWIDVEKKHDEL